MNKQFLSVAMCTYNGALYLQEQLDSIAAQTRLPDELVVCDDSSNDVTLQILEDFQKMAPFSVRVYHNEARLGPTKNYEKAIILCSGDIISLSDQDDLWMPQKLERLERSLEDYPEANYVFSDALVVDEMLRFLGYSMWKRVSFTARKRRRFENGRQLQVLLKCNIVTGATMAFRAELCDWILPIPDQWVHDAWISLIASAAGAIGIFIREALIKYRQHPNQVIGGMKVSFHDRFMQLHNSILEPYNFEKFKYILDRLSLVGKMTKEAKQLIEAKLTHLQTRQRLYEHSHCKCFGQVLKELLCGRYHKYSDGWKSVAKDLFIAIK